MQRPHPDNKKTESISGMLFHVLRRSYYNSLGGLCNGAYGFNSFFKRLENKLLLAMQDLKSNFGPPKLSNVKTN